MPTSTASVSTTSGMARRTQHAAPANFGRTRHTGGRRSSRFGVGRVVAGDEQRRGAVGADPDAGDGLWEFPRPGFELRIRPDTVEESVLQPPCARAPRHRGRKPCMRGWGPEHLTEDPSRPRSRRRGSFWDCCSRPSRPHLKPTLLWPNRQPPADIRRQTSEAHSLVLRVPMTTSATRMVTMRTANTMISGTPMPSIGAYLPSAARRLHGRVTGSPDSYPPDLSSLCLDWVCETGGVARQQLDRSRRRVMPRS